METSKNGGPAFPGEYDGLQRLGSTGMSLRDWFAGQALAGLCSAQDKEGNWTGDSTVDVQDEAYRIADKMLERRER